MQRIPLVIEAGQSHLYYDDSPPRTPTHVKRVARGKGRGGASRAVRSRPALGETLDNTVAEDQVRGTEKGQRTHDRDSHDLSLSPSHVTRASVVDNMLLSLDQFSTSGAPNPRFANAERSRSLASTDRHDIYSAGLRLNSAGKGRRRGHTQSSSLSFEPDLRPDDASSRSNSHIARSRRSNSSATFHSAPRRVDYICREDESTKNGANVTATQGAAAFVGGDTTVASRGGRKGSRGSGSSSLDMSHTVGGSRRQYPTEHVSSSYDRSYGVRGTHLSPSTRTASMVNSRSEPRLYDDYEAAPTPIIPVGTRRERISPSAIYPPQLSPASSKDPFPRLQNSVEPSGGRSGDWALLETEDTVGAQSKREEQETTRATLGEVPSPPALFNPPVLSPSMSTEKPFAPSIQGAAPSMRERPGFFRRVFGSSRSTSSTLSDSRRPSSAFAEPIPLQTGSRADSRSVQGSQIPPQSKLQLQSVRSGTPLPPSKDPSKDTSQAQLSKKTSSFFRRRKKSFSEQHPLPPFAARLPFSPNDIVLDQPADQSPVSSLRKVMNPYLRDAITPHSDEQQGEGLSDYDAAFLAGYTARNESSVKHFKAASASLDHAPPSRKSPSTDASEWPALDPNPPTNHDDSFFQDSSSNEGKSLTRTSNLQLDLARVAARRRSNPDTPKPAEPPTPLDGKGRHQVGSPIVSDQPGPGEGNPGVDAKHQSPPRPNLVKSKQTAKGVPDGAEPTEWITAAHLTSARNALPPRIAPGKSDRVWLEPTSSEEEVNKSAKRSQPLKGAPASTGASESSTSDYKSASSRLPSSAFKPSPEVAAMPIEAEHVVDTPCVDATEATEEDRQQAKGLYDGDEEHVAKDKAAAWLGDAGTDSAPVLRAYMELFDWRNLNILASLRDLCGRLLLKGETQQVDRVLDAFSLRWCSCNSNHGFKTKGVSFVAPPPPASTELIVSQMLCTPYAIRFCFLTRICT